MTAYSFGLNCCLVDYSLLRGLYLAIAWLLKHQKKNQMVERLVNDMKSRNRTGNKTTLLTKY